MVVRGNFLSLTPGWGCVLHGVAVIAYNQWVLIGFSVRDPYHSSDSKFGSLSMVWSGQGLKECQPHCGGQVLSIEGLEKDPDWWNLWETLLKGHQSSFGDILAGVQGCWVQSLEGLVLGQPTRAACLPLQLKGELCLEKELWVTSRSDACSLA